MNLACNFKFIFSASANTNYWAIYLLQRFRGTIHIEQKWFFVIFHLFQSITLTKAKPVNFSCGFCKNVLTELSFGGIYFSLWICGWKEGLSNHQHSRHYIAPLDGSKADDLRCFTDMNRFNTSLQMFCRNLGNSLEIW